jgi:hypothetical protein
MTTAEMFRQFLSNLTIKEKETISYRYGEITSALNKKYREIESKTANSLQVGSIGRHTAIEGISDLDMLYMMTNDTWDRFKENRQSDLLQEVKNAIKTRYPNTEASGNGQVVTVKFSDGMDVEVLPAFEQDDGSFKFPDTNDGGSWRITKPREEIQAVAKLNDKKNGNVRDLCRMVRAWKNKHGLGMGGLLIDTLVYNFLDSRSDYDTTAYASHGQMVRDYFEYLSKEPEKAYYLAPGSNQQVYVKRKFQGKAKKAFKLAEAAISASGKKSEYKAWKKIFGTPYPTPPAEVAEKALTKLAQSWKDTEQFIEDLYPVDIRYNLIIDCEVSQNGFRENTLRNMRRLAVPLLPKKRLHFWVEHIDVPHPYQLKWKVLNRGEMAERLDKIRGEIVDDNGHASKIEHTDFQGDHVVECYAIKDDVVVAKNRIHVPIQT